MNNCYYTPVTPSYPGVLILKIGVISDTHDNLSFTKKIIQVLLNNEIEALIHLGDFTSPFTVRFIHELINGSVNTVIAVLGNNDGDILSISKLFNQYGWQLNPSPCIVEIEGRKFYLMHGTGPIDFTEKIVRSVFEKLDVDAVLYGHTHMARYERAGSKILLNPGEVCGYIAGKVSAALLETRDQSVEFIELQNN